MKQRELAEQIAENVIDTIYEAVREQAGSEALAIAVLSQIKSKLNKFCWFGWSLFINQ